MPHEKNRDVTERYWEEDGGTVYMNVTTLGDARREQQSYSHCMER